MSETATAPAAAPAAPAAAPVQKDNNPVHGLQERLVHEKIIPKKTHWEETIWKGPIDFVTKQSGSLTHDLGNLAGKVTDVAGGAVNSASDSLQRPAGGFHLPHLPKFGGDHHDHGPWRTRALGKTKAQVGEWLAQNGLSDYKAALESNQVDGTGLVALHEIWAVDKLGFLKYAQESLQITTPGHALRFGVKLEELPSFLWEDDKAAKEKESKDAPKNA